MAIAERSASRQPNTAKEYDDSRDAYVTQAPFRAYKTVVDSVAVTANSSSEVPSTAPRSRRRTTLTSSPRRIADATYTTDPAYASKLIGLMVKYDLYRFDQGP